MADETLYGCTYSLLEHGMSQFGVKVTLTDLSDIENLKKAMTEKTKVVYFETPCNPTMKILDIALIAKTAHDFKSDIRVIVDNTFCTPYLQQPLALGANTVVHSATKYLNGHGDVIAGVIVGDKEFVGKCRMFGLKDLTGAVMSPFDAFLMARGMKTLDIRMERHCANAKKVAAVSTTPVNKESFKAGGVNFIGHTEIFGALTGTPDPLTLFEVHGMRVFFLTRHVSLRQACDLITKERIKDYVHRCTEALRVLGITEGTMAVAGLNPHSGEHGLFGDEEVRAVIPAVEELQKEGYQVVGPIGADSVFHQALQGRYNSVLSLYHDQGHIATKTLDFERTIAVTAGMPILRTSVDHGTALDIAGTGKASAVSLIEAVRLAVKYAPSFMR